MTPEEAYQEAQKRIQACLASGEATLNLFGLGLQRVPPELGQLSNLQYLYLDQNQLTAVPPELADLAEGDSLKHFFLHENRKLGVPDEVLGPTWEEFNSSIGTLQPKPPREIAAYLRSIQFGKAKALNEAKLLVVGPGGAGKSSLIEKLVEGTFQKGRDSTEGVEVTAWKIRSGRRQIKLNIWDFGGQEIQHSTHEFFLTKRAVYLLVFNPRDDQGTQHGLHYWLELISVTAPGCPIIVALSKQDEHEASLDDQDDLLKRYPILDFVRVSCDESHKAHDNIDRILRKQINIAVLELPHVDNRLPTSWLNVKKALEKDQHNFLSYADYLALCNRKKVQNELHQKLLVNLLHDLGTMLNYADRLPLEQTHILNPSWVTHGVYGLVLCDQLEESHGILEESLVEQLEQLVADMHRREGRNEAAEAVKGHYPREAQVFILEMMRRFELCYELRTSTTGPRRYLVPNALPKRRPAALDFPDTELPTESVAATTDESRPILFEYRYPRILPTSVISQFIVGMESQRMDDQRWRQGLCSTLDDHRYLVEMHAQDKRIRIAIAGPSAGREHVLDRLRWEFDKIHAHRSGLEPEAWVLDPDDPAVAVEFAMLEQLEEQGIPQLPVMPDGQKKMRMVDVGRLLRGIGQTHATLRQSLLRFTDDELRDLCQDHFNEVYRDLGEGTAKREFVRRLIDEAQSNDRLDELKRLAERHVR